MSTIGYRLVAAFTIILSAVIVFAGVAALAHFWIGASAGDGIMMGGFAGACAGIGAGIAFVESGGDGD